MSEQSPTPIILGDIDVAAERRRAAAERRRAAIEASSVPRLLVKPLLHDLLHPEMERQSFANWVCTAIRKHGFPAPVRLGKRNCAWREDEVLAWLASRERGGTFAGRRRGEPAA